jgi:predicted secreted protein
MRRLLCSALALPLALPLLFSQPAAAQDNKVTLMLGESAERAVTQDRLKALLRVEAGGGDPRAVQAQVNQKMTQTLERVRAVAAVKAETQGYYVYEDKSLKRGQRWWGSQGISLTSTDGGALLALVGQLQENGVLVSNLAYELAPETRRRIERELVPEAIQRVKETAETVARSLALPTVQIVKVRLGDSSPPLVPRAFGAVAMAAERAAVPPPVAEPGETIVSVRIEAEVALSK